MCVWKGIYLSWDLCVCIWSVGICACAYACVRICVCVHNYACVGICACVLQCVKRSALYVCVTVCKAVNTVRRSERLRWRHRRRQLFLQYCHENQTLPTPGPGPFHTSIVHWQRPIPIWHNSSAGCWGRKQFLFVPWNPLPVSGWRLLPSGVRPL